MLEISKVCTDECLVGLVTVCLNLGLPSTKLCTLFCRVCTFPLPPTASVARTLRGRT